MKSHFFKERRMKRNVIARSIIAASIAAAAVGGYTHFENGRWGRADAAVLNPAQQPAAAVATAVPGMATATDFSGIVRRYGPAVVNISVVGKAEQTPTADDAPQLDPNDPFSDFFRFFGPQGPRPVPRGGQIMRGEGSGFIISPDGLIMTNAHVVDGADQVTVKLTDRREFKAKVLGFDKKSDVAVIRIDAKNLPTVKLGNPDASQVGEPVLAIGSPYGFENSATAGIISAKSRSLPEDTYVPFLQTDVAVNPGNSGGPLFNLKGEVIGINSQIYSRTGGYQGLSFAIPIDVASNVEQQLVKYGKVTRGRLGVSVQDVTQALADSFGLERVRGALVSSVEKGSPADHAGLQPGDVIVKLDDHEITRSSDLPALVAAMSPGTNAKIEVLRKGSSKTLNVTIGQMKDAKVAQARDARPGEGRLGLALRPLAPDEQRQAGVSGGLLVEDASGPAARSGIQQGDIVLSINGRPVSTPEQLRSLAAKAGKHVALLVQRDENKIFIPVDLG
jgi:serine protease Do